ncbi:MAG: Gfo/Idh/MocA family oxidoreductase [Spirochaetales bacterium]|nr:Gfo/Idh/MocA family oxidoreductase [Spirochaetales bacterium]
MEPVRIALIGCGKRTKNIYVPIIKKMAPFITCTGVYNRSEAPVQEIGMMLGVPFFTSIEELIEKTRFDIAVICVNRAAHLVPSLTCIKAGKHLLIETPIAESLDDARKIIALADKAGVTIEIAENVPRHPELLFLRKCIQHGLFGKINIVYSNFIGHGYHGVSSLRSMLGWDVVPRSVSALRRDFPVVQHEWRDGQPERNVETWTHGIIDFSNNAVGIYDFSSLTYGSPLRRDKKENMLTLYGEKGMIWNSNLLVLEGRKNRQMPEKSIKYVTIDGVETIDCIVLDSSPEIEWKNPLSAYALDTSEIGIALSLYELVTALQENQSPEYGAINGYIDRKTEILFEESAEQDGRKCLFNQDIR